MTFLTTQYYSGAVLQDHIHHHPHGEENASLVSPSPNKVTFLSRVAEFSGTMVSSCRAADLQELERHHAPLH